MPQKIKNSKNKNNVSFTLIELLVVLAIIGVLAGIIIVNMSDAQASARDARRMSDLDQMKSALEIYRANKLHYPIDTTDGTGFCMKDNPSFLAEIQPYAPNVPQDPLGGDWPCYRYYGDSTGTGYVLTAKLEVNKSAMQNDRGQSNDLYEVFNETTYAQGYGGGGGGGYGGGSGCPAGFVWVPVTADTYAYISAPFCVMQYEAKCDVDGDGIGETVAEIQTKKAKNCAADQGGGVDWQDCSGICTVVSSAQGAPIVNITHDQAKTVCPSGSHLILNNEWMAIARNAERVASNWTMGVVGSGCLFRGNSGDTTCGYNASLDPDYGTSRNSRAKLTLSNGTYVYDIAGNVWDHVMVDASDTKISLAEQPEATTDGTNPITDTAFYWSEFSGSGSTRRLLNDGSGPLNYSVFRPSSSSYNSNYGVGQIFHWSNSSDTNKNRVFLRGGGRGDGTCAGAFALHLYWYASKSYNVGFRCVQ